MSGEGGHPSWFGRLVAALTTHGESVGNVLVYSSAYLAVVTVVEVAIVMVLLSLPMNLAPVVGGLVTFAVYANDRIADVEEDALTRPSQAAFVRRHEARLYVLAALAYGLAVALSVLGGPLALAITVLPGILWVLYALEWIPPSVLQFRRLKDVFLVNSLVVAIAWATSLTFLPLAFAGVPATGTAGVVFAYFFFRSFVDTEIPNVRDVEADRAMDIRTLPAVVGVDRTRRLLTGLDLLTAGLVAFAVYVDLLPAVLAVPIGIGLAYSLGVTSLVGRIDDDVVTVAVEFEYFVVGLALLVVVYGA